MQKPYARCKSVLGMFLVLSAVVLGAGHRVKPLTEKQAAEYQLDTAFYKKCTMVQDILIATSKRVSDLTHLEAAYQFDMVMKRIDPAIAQRVRDRKVLCILIGCKEFTSEIPQFATDKTGKELDYYNWRSRGFLSWKGGRPTVVFAEEDVLEYEGGMQLESILIHEFAHVICGAGFDKDLQERLKKTFEEAKTKGLWNDGRAAQRFRRVKSQTPVSLLDALVKSFSDQSPELIAKCLDGGSILVNGKRVNSKVKVNSRDKVMIVFGGEKECYAGKNRSEYWAEGVQNWYDTNRTMDHDHNHINTRRQLKSYDPGLAKLCEDVLGNSKWRFVSPRKRAGTEHLKGFDPATAPKVEKAEHIKQAANDYYDKYWKDYWLRLYDKYGVPVPTAAPKLLDRDRPEIRAVVEEDRIAVTVAGKIFTCYKFDKEQKYPYFWPVNGPVSGKSITTETSEPYPHHHSLFFGCDKVNGGNYWQDVNERGQIVSQTPKLIKSSGDSVVFTDTCLWRQPGAEPIIRDTRRITITAPDAEVRIIDFAITLEPLVDIEILKNNHSLFAARVVPELSVKSGGTLINAQGQTAKKGTWGVASPWCDYSGTRDGAAEGIAIMQHPANRWYPAKWFTRDYGFFSPTPMYWLKDNRLDIPKGEKLTLNYRVVVHAGNAKQADIKNAFDSYKKTK